MTVIAIVFLVILAILFIACAIDYWHERRTIRRRFKQITNIYRRRF